MIRSALAMAMALALAACSPPAPETTTAKSDTPAASQTEEAAHVNPLLTASTLPMQAPPFDRFRMATISPPSNRA